MSRDLLCFSCFTRIEKDQLICPNCGVDIISVSDVSDFSELGGYSMSTKIDTPPTPIPLETFEFSSDRHRTKVFGILYVTIGFFFYIPIFVTILDLIDLVAADQEKHWSAIILPVLLFFLTFIILAFIVYIPYKIIIPLSNDMKIIIFEDKIEVHHRYDPASNSTIQLNDEIISDDVLRVQKFPLSNSKLIYYIQENMVKLNRYDNGDNFELRIPVKNNFIKWIIEHEDNPSIQLAYQSHY